MRIHKKINNAVVFVIIIILLTTGCRTKNITVPDAFYGQETYQYATAAPGTSGKRMEISVGLDGFTAVNDGVGRIIMNHLNISLTPVDVTEQNEDFLTSLAASGALPDVLRIDTAMPYFIRWVEQGTIRDIPAARIKKHERLAALTDGSGELMAVNRIYGKKNLFIPVGDAVPYLTADSGRIYYRKDWLNQLDMEEPETVEAFKDMLQTFAQKNLSGRSDTAGLTLAGGVTYLLALFGTDPESWIYEEGQWMPAYYSERMLEGLNYARSLYVEGLLDYEYAITKTNTAINKLAVGAAGSVVRHGDIFWLNRVLRVFAERNGMTEAEAYENNIGILPPPATANGKFWPRAVETGGCVINASVTNEKLDRILALLEYTLSDEGRELAYFGVRGETCGTDADDMLKLFIDPETARPFDILEQYPATTLLFILDRSRYRLGENDENIPSEVQPEIKTACYETAALYNDYAIDEGDGFLIRFIRTPAKDALEKNIDPSTAFNVIVTGTEPVEDMFTAFKQDCDEKNIRAAMEEVTARMNEILKGD